MSCRIQKRCSRILDLFFLAYFVEQRHPHLLVALVQCKSHHLLAKLFLTTKEFRKKEIIHDRIPSFPYAKVRCMKSKLRHPK